MPVENEEVEMLTDEMTRERIRDLVRVAEAERLARSTRAGRTADRQGAVRRATSAVLTALLWPVRH